MKTNYFSSKRLSIYSLFGLIAVVVSSCGSYQNSSYYDGDGVYGNSQNKREVSNKDNSQSNKYQEYFSDLNKDSQAFTNVDNYSTVNNDTINKTENYNSNNSSWGNNPQSVTVNVYDSNWGYGYWNNYWYGNYWGLNSWYGPNWGWGWNNWYGNTWCGGYYQPYFQQYHQGTRSFAAVNNNQNYSGNRYDNGRRNNASGTRTANNNYSGTRNEGAIRNPRSSTNFGTPRNPIRNSTNINSNNTTPRFNSNSTPRSQSNSTRNFISTPTRSNSSSSGSYNSGGRSSGGNYGGGRSSGGRR